MTSDIYAITGPIFYFDVTPIVNFSINVTFAVGVDSLDDVSNNYINDVDSTSHS